MGHLEVRRGHCRRRPARIYAETGGRIGHPDVLGRVTRVDNQLTVDHIVPVLEICLMENFHLLDDDTALRILNWHESLVPLAKGTNSARREAPWDGWQGWRMYATPAQRAEMISRAERLRSRIERMVAVEVQRTLARMGR